MTGRQKVCTKYCLSLILKSLNEFNNRKFDSFEKISGKGSPIWKGFKFE